MKDLAFEYLQFCTKNKLMIDAEESVKLFGTNIDDETMKESSSMLMDILMKGGIIYDESILTYKNIDEYLNFITKSRLERRKNQLNDWIQDRSARKFFTERKPKNKKEEKLFDKLEETTEIINEYWDTKYFNEKELSKQFICICERDYGGENRIGIMVKQEPYAHQYSIVVRGIIGPYNVANDGTGWDLELEKGAERFSLSKTYKNFPTKDELIDDFVSLDILESQPPIDHIRNDISTIPIYPTAKEYFK